MDGGKAVEAVAGRGRASVSPSEQTDQLMAELVELRSVINAAEARCAEIVAGLAEDHGHPLGCRSVAQFLGWQAGLSPTAAKTLEQAAEAVSKFPSLAVAARAGAISVSQTAEIGRTVTADSAAADLAEQAQHATFGQLRTACRAIRRERHDDTGRSGEHAARYLRSWFTDTGRFRIAADLDAEEGVLWSQAIAHAEAHTPDPEAGVQDRADARGADALGHITRAYLTSVETGNESTTPDVALTVHVPVEELTGAAGGSARIGWTGPTLPLSAARLLACDSVIRTLITDRDGTPLALGRTRRVVSGRQRRALLARDRGCAVPGCGSRRHLHAHHVIHWADGGATDLDNLVLVCTWHHKLVHLGLVRIARTSDGLDFTGCSEAMTERRPNPRVSGDPPFAAATLGLTPSPTAATNRWDGRPTQWDFFDPSHYL